MKSQTLHEIWQERGLLAPAFAAAIGTGYLPLLVLPWTFGALVANAGYTESQAGWIATAEIGALATASLLAARCAALSGRRWAAAGGMLVAALANAIAATASPASAAFLAMRMLSGAGCGVAVAVGNAAAANSANPARAFAVMWFLMGLWQLVIFSLTPWIIARAGLPGIYGVVAIACLAYLPLGLQMPDPGSNATSGAASGHGVSPRSWLAVVTLSAVLCFWFRDALVYSMSQRLAVPLGITAQQLGALLGIASVVGLAGPALAARIGNGPSLRALASSLLLTLGISSVMAIGVSGLAFSVATLLMPASGLLSASLLYGLSARVDASGRVAAMAAGLGFASEAIGPALGGSLMEFGGRSVFSAVVMGAGLLTLAAALAAGTSVRRTRSMLALETASTPKYVA